MADVNDGRILDPCRRIGSEEGYALGAEGIDDPPQRLSIAAGQPSALMSVSARNNHSIMVCCGGSGAVAAIT